MSMKNGVWHNAKVDLPPDGEKVLCVCRCWNGRIIRIGTHWSQVKDADGWITGGAFSEILYWMPLPKIPED